MASHAAHVSHAAHGLSCRSCLSCRSWPLMPLMMPLMASHAAHAAHDMASHATDLSRVLGKLTAAGFTLRGSKCFFGKSSMSHLGFQYSNNGVSPTAEKTTAILEWPRPKCLKEVRSFVGLANFYRRFVPRFADIAAPLSKLTGNQTVFKWEDEHEKAFNALKQSLSSPPVIATLNRAIHSH